MIKGMNHVGLSVADLDRAVRFYRQAFGMEIEVDGAFGGESYEAILNLRGARGRAALLRMPGSELRLELFQFTAPPAKPADPDRPVCDHGITHFCIEVENIEAEYRRLKDSGVAFHCPPRTFQPSGNKATYGRDPDGNVFEMFEAARPR